MPAFQYIAVTADGQQRKGSVTADDRVAALASIEAMGLFPTQVDDAGGSTQAVGLGGRAKRGSRVKNQQVLEFIRQLANLLSAGVSLSRSLQILSKESSHAGASSLWKAIHDEVADGTSLADAMRQHPKVFAPVYVAMVRAGETGGFLEVVLKQIADFMSRERELKSKVYTAMIYPSVLAVIAVAVVTFLLSWFIPRFSAIFEEFGEALPLLTRIIQAASLAVRNYGLFVLIAAVIVGLALQRMLQSDAGRRWRDQTVLRLPGVGPAVSRFALVRFTRMLGTLVGAGVPLVAALRVAKEAVGNQTLTDTLADTIHKVQEGVTLAKSLAGCPQLFSVSVVEMVAVAEQSGKLDSELVRMAAEFEGDLDRRLRVLVSLAEPALLFVMATVVGTIVIGMLLPVFDLWDAIK